MLRSFARSTEYVKNVTMIQILVVLFVELGSHKDFIKSSSMFVGGLVFIYDIGMSLSLLAFFSV